MGSPLKRIGNKSKLASKIIQHFPKHDTYIEMFFGAGGLFFHKKPRAKYNILNDIDDDVYNFYNVITNHKNEFLEAIGLMPIHQSLFKYWQKNTEQDPIKKALRIVLLSNFSLYGVGGMLRLTAANNIKSILIENIKKTNMANTVFTCLDFREIINSIEYNKNTKERSFIYADPPYLGTSKIYNNNFNENDTIDLFEILVNTGIKFAISEYSNEFIINLANSYNLNIIEIAEVRSINSRNTELLITNYKTTNLFN